MSTEIVRQAVAEAREASAQADQLTLLTAALLAQTQQQGCQHHHAPPAPQRAPMDLRKVAVIGGGVVVGGAVLTGMFLAIALCAGSLGLTAVVIRWLVKDMQRGRS